MSWEYTGETKKIGDIVLRRIRATSDIIVADGLVTVKNGTTGGWIESDRNLSPEAWIGGDACVSDDARVFDHAQVVGHARVDGHARVGGDAEIGGRAHVGDYVWVTDHACIGVDAEVGGCARVEDHAEVGGNARVEDHAEVGGNARIGDHARVGGNARIGDHAQVNGCARIEGYAWVGGHVHICGDALVACCEDFMVFKNTWSSKRHFTYTRSNGKWSVGCFYGTGDELVEKAYADNALSGRCYEAVVDAVRAIESAKNREEIRIERREAAKRKT